MSHPYKAKVGTIEVHVNDTRTRGYMECDRRGELGQLLIEDEKLIDYDGVYTLPREVKRALALLGIRIETKWT